MRRGKRHHHSITSSARSNSDVHFDPDCFGRLEVEDCLEFGCSLDRQVGWLCPFEDFIDKGCCPPVHVGKAYTKR